MSDDDDDWLADLVPDGIVATDRAGRITAWNQGAATLYGWSPDEALGRDADALLASRHPFGLGAIRDELIEAGAWAGEVFRRTRDGREVCVRVRRRVRRDGNGVAGIVEWGRGAQEVSAGEIAAHRYTNLFHAMAASFWELDFSQVRKAVGELLASGVDDVAAYLRGNRGFVDRAIDLVRVVDVNDKTIEMFGAPSREAVLAGPMSWAWPAASRGVFAESLIAAAMRRDSYSTETRLSRMDGTAIDALFTVCWPSDHKAQGTVLVGVIDITDRQRAYQELEASEHRYRDLFEHVPVALLQLDMTPLQARLDALRDEGVEDPTRYVETTPGFLDEVLALPRIEQANAEARRLFGADPADDLCGPIAWGWRDRPETIRRSLVARLRAEPRYSEETRVNRRDGSAVDVLYTMSFTGSLVAKGINVAGFVDISDRKRADHDLRISEQRFRDLQAEFSHAARVSLLGELTASIAHEVNQPLAAISTLGQAALRWLGRPEPDLAEVATLAGHIVADAQRASDIIARIRGMTVKREPDRRPVPVRSVIDEALLIVRHEGLDKGVTIRTDLAEDLPPVQADRVQLQQVMVNLAMNAIQAMAARPDGERVLAVGARLAGQEVEIAVDDTGPGIAAEDIDRLFSGFFTTRQDGMGIGLSICRSIVQAHEGRIAARNRETGGARFVVSLPAIDGFGCPNDGPES